MSDVLATLPDPLRGATTEITASSTSDVTLVLELEDGGTKTVVWGDARDAELKADVVETLLGQPGSTIDVSSPVAPVTR
jgi:cell division protein FtsQ